MTDQISYDELYKIRLNLIQERNKFKDENKLIKGFIKMALNELGVPTKDYIAPVANAVDFLKEALKETGE